MNRKLLPCLLAAGLAALSGCNKNGANGSGPGVVAKDDPLTYVPADTPYVFANIDPVPAEVSDAWIARVDAAGKLGDIYAAEIDIFTKATQDQDAQCAASKEPAQTDAPASGGGGGAMQDGSPAHDEADSPVDDGDAANAMAASEADAGTPPVAGLSAPSTYGAADKCSPKEVASRDAMRKVLGVMRGEVAGKDVRGLLDLAGLSTRSHVAVYGIGLVPVVRIELAKPDNLRALIGRFEKAVNDKFPTGKVGGLDYWIVSTEQPDAKLEGVFAISGKQLVVTFAPVKPSDADLRVLFGLDKPKKSLADDGALAAMNKKLNYLSYGSGYFDSARLVAELKAPPSPLETSFLAALHETKPAIDAQCATEYDQLAAAWPRASFGYAELAPKHMAVRGVIEARADIAKDLMTLRAPMPGLAAGQDGLFDLGYSADLARIPELANKYADAIAKSPWKCASLAQMNEGAEKSRSQLTNPGFAGMAPMFRGFHAIFDKLELKDDQPIPEFAAVIAIGSANPANLLNYANSLPGMADLGLKNDGVAKQVPPMPNLPLKEPMFVAMTDKVLAVSIGAGEEAKIPGAMKTDPAQQPLFEFGGKGDIYHLLAQWERKMAKSGDPSQQQIFEQQAKMFDAQAAQIKHVDVRVDLTEQGIEFKESVDAP